MGFRVKFRGSTTGCDSELSDFITMGFRVSALQAKQSEQFIGEGL